MAYSMSVVVPAHNEQAVIARCLSFVADLAPNECRVVVVANGCTDETVAVARRAIGERAGVTILDLREAGKWRALNVGDDAAGGIFPRVYVDADVVVTATALRRLRDGLPSVEQPRVAAPRPRFSLSGRPWSVRAFYRVFESLPYAEDGLVGLGVYALNEAGHARLDGFPDLMADDLYVQRSFDPSERVLLDDHFDVETPRSFAALVQVRTRIAAGNTQLAATRSSDDRYAASSRGTIGALLGLARSRPSLLPAATVYLVVGLLARLRARRRTDVWERDVTTRKELAEHAFPVSGDSAMRARVAYLLSHYPALSTAFVDREITALRALGREVVTVAVRPPQPNDLLTEHARRAAACTTVLLDADASPVLLNGLAFALRHPAVLLRNLRRALATGAPRIRHRVWQMFYLAEAVTLLRVLDRAAIRHIHVHFASNAADIARAAVHLGNDRDGGGWSWSLSMHGPTEFEDPVGFDVAAKVASATAVACITDFCRSQLMRWTPPELWSRLHLVRMSVDQSAYPVVDRTARDPSDPLRVLFVGRLVPEKGPTLLLDAVEQLDGVPVLVQVVGAGHLADSLVVRVAERGLADRVELVGPVGQEELPARYAWADVLCMPSFAEGLPVVLMEALATALPVVTTPIAGITELVTHEVTGLLVAPGRADALAEALRRLHADPPLRHQLGDAGRRRVQEMHTPEPNALALDALLP